MKVRRLLPVIIVPLLLSCAPKKIEIPMTEAPADRLVQALSDRARSFQTLRALAEVTVTRKDRKRTFETVGVLVSGRERFKLEAYGPLGQSVAMVLWAGNDVLVDTNGEQHLLPAKGAGLERILGAELAPAELCAIMSGNVPGDLNASNAKMFCAANNSCILELREGERLIKVYPAMGWEPGPSSLPLFEVYQGKKLVYRVRYETFASSAGYDLPRQITVENPGKQMSLRIGYAEVEVNVPLDGALFSMSEAGR